MSPDPIGAVLARSKQRGTRLFVLVLIAYSADPQGEWRVNLTTLARLARLQRRQLLEILHHLTATHELEIRSSKGHHVPSTYRLLLPGTRAENRTPPPPSPVHKTAPVPPTPAKNRTCSPPQPVRETAPPSPFFPPHPPLTPDSPSLPLLSSTPFPSGKGGGAPLPGGGSACGRGEGGEGQTSDTDRHSIAAVQTQLRTAGVALPAPSQIDRWLTLLGLGPLQTLLTRLIAANLAGKNHPSAYINTCVMDRAANPAGTPSALPSDTPAGRPKHRTLPPAMAVGADDQRREQLRRLTANAKKESHRS